MSRSLAILGLWLAAACGCMGESRLSAPKLDAAGSTKQALIQYDGNGDGFIADKELENCPGLKAAMRMIDRDHDGKVSAAELETRLQEFADSKTAFYSATCQVNFNGKPLPGATVRLVPEPFMGPTIKPAQGETDANGVCTPAAEGASDQGVNFGIYRIEVSKKDGSGNETLPAKYNSQTVLGDAVPGGSNVEGGIVLNLTSS